MVSLSKTFLPVLLLSLVRLVWKIPRPTTFLQLNGRIRTPAPARSLAVRQRSTFTLARPLPRNRPSNPDHEPKRDAFRDTIGRQRNLQPTENLRYMLHLHREQQRSIRRQHEETLAEALHHEIPCKPKVIRLHAPTPSDRKKAAHIRSRTHSTRERFAKRRAFLFATIITSCLSQDHLTVFF